VDADAPPPPQKLEADPGTFDRKILYVLYTLVVLMAAFVLWTSWEQTLTNDRHHEIIVMLEQQNRDLLCFADATHNYEIAAAQALLAQSNGPDSTPLPQQLDELRRQLVASKARCLAATQAASTTTTP
jgi:hypothetical protein